MQGETGLKYFFVSIIQSLTVYFIELYQDSDDFDPVTKTWHGTADGISFGEYALSWMQHGAKAVGGCCQTVAHHIKEVAKARDSFNKMIKLR